ncbi:MAG: S8 family serine peptidase [Actinomycetota bacterium]|nr:S8 family serine peptidase [Actinomycetota bacterium]
MQRIAIAAAVVAVALVFSASPVFGGAEPVAHATSAADAIDGDLDGDKMFDDLEARLADAPADARVDVIVTLAEPQLAERIAGLMKQVGPFDVRRPLGIVNGFSATVRKGQVAALARLPEVVHVEENGVVRALNDTAQASFGVTKARVDASALDGDGDADSSTYSKADLVAAVIDTGIDAAHGDLDDGKVLAFKDFVNGRDAPYDDHGHGTHVAATIAGDGEARADGLHRGVAPAAALVGVKVLDADGSGTTEDVVAALEWLIENKNVYGIEAVNLSLGESGCSDGTSADSVAVEKARDAGLVVVVAAGNDGPGTCTVGAPGAAAAALTVGAMADLGAGGFRQASFSSRGPTADGRVKPDVSAAGVAITSAQAGTASGYATYSGTSMATPFTAGVALLMLDADASLTPQEVKDRIMRTAIDWGRGGDNRTAGSTGVDNDYGAGRLDAYRAIAAAGAPLSAPPGMPVHQLREGSLPARGAKVDYRLDVVDATTPVAATLIMSDLAAASSFWKDFDLYLYDPTGALVASGTTDLRQDSLAFKPAKTGVYTLRVLSYKGSGSYFVDISAGLGVPPPATPDFALATSPASATTTTGSGSGGVYTVAVTSLNGFDGDVSLAVGGLPSGASASWAPGSTVPRGSGSAQVTVTASAETPVGTYPLTITGTSGSLVRSSSATLVVASAASSTAASPTTTTIQSGSLRGGTVSSLGADDLSYYELNSTSSFFSAASSWYGTFTGLPRAPSKLAVAYKGKNSAACTQTVSIWRWPTSSWVQLDSRTVSTETQVDAAVGGALNEFVSSSGDVRVRVRCQRSSAFFASGNLLRITYTP